jgi:hypothetical protein
MIFGIAADLVMKLERASHVRGLCGDKLKNLGGVSD